MSDTSTPREDDNALAAEYALGLTPAAEFVDTRRRAFIDLAFAAQVAMWH